MSESERGPLVEYELRWTSGHTERILAHQMLHLGQPMMFFASTNPQVESYMFHGEFDGVWQLVLQVRASEIASIRNVTRTESGVPLDPGASS